MFNYIFWIFLLAGNAYVVIFVIREQIKDIETLYDSLNKSFDQINLLHKKINVFIENERVLRIKNISLHETIDKLEIENAKLKKRSS